jgi:hypothetical protein
MHIEGHDFLQQTKEIQNEPSDISGPLISYEQSKKDRLSAFGTLI